MQGEEKVVYYHKRHNGKSSYQLISHPYLCQAISIMLSMAPNTGWVERGYSILEMICSKRRNCLDPVNMEPLFLLAVLKLSIKSSGDYKNEIATMYRT